MESAAGSGPFAALQEAVRALDISLAAGLLQEDRTAELEAQEDRSTELAEQLRRAAAAHDALRLESLLEGCDAAVLAQRDACGHSLLHLCAPCNRCLQPLLARGGSSGLNAKNCLGETALTLAVRAAVTSKGQAAAVELLLQARAEPDAADAPMWETPLMEAACAGSLSACRLLLDWRADPERRSFGGLTAADFTDGPPELLRLLEERRVVCAPTTPRLPRGGGLARKDPLDEAMRAAKNLDAGALHVVLDSNPRDLVLRPNSKGQSLLHVAALTPPSASEAPEAQVIVRLLLLKAADVTQQDMHGETPLASAVHAAIGVRLEGPAQCDESRLYVVRALLAAAADVNTTDMYNGETPLMEAACERDLDLCRLLLASRAQPQQRSASGMVALDFLDGDDHDLQELLQEASSSNEPAEGQDTGHAAAATPCAAGQVEVEPERVEPRRAERQEKAVRAAEDVEVELRRVERQEEAVRAAGGIEAELRRVEWQQEAVRAAERVEAKQAQADLRSTEGTEEEHSDAGDARRRGSKEPELAESTEPPQRTRSAESKERDRDAARRPPRQAPAAPPEQLLGAMRDPHPPTVRKLLKALPDAAAAVGARDPDGLALLHYCVMGPPSDKVFATAALLLQHRAEVNARNLLGETPLLLATRAALDHEDDVAPDDPLLRPMRKLLEARADPDAADLLGETSLVEAACRGATEVCKLLLSARANPVRESSCGLAALKVAQCEGHTEVVKLLQAACEPALLSVHVPASGELLEVRVHPGSTVADLQPEVRARLGLGSSVGLVLRTAEGAVLAEEALLDGYVRLVADVEAAPGAGEASPAPPLQSASLQPEPPPTEALGSAGPAAAAAEPAEERRPPEASLSTPPPAPGEPAKVPTVPQEVPAPAEAPAAATEAPEAPAEVPSEAPTHAEVPTPAEAPPRTAAPAAARVRTETQEEASALPSERPAPAPPDASALPSERPARAPPDAPAPQGSALPSERPARAPPDAPAPQGPVPERAAAPAKAEAPTPSRRLGWWEDLPDMPNDDEREAGPQRAVSEELKLVSVVSGGTGGPPPLEEDDGEAGTGGQLDPTVQLERLRGVCASMGMVMEWCSDANTLRSVLRIARAWDVASVRDLKRECAVRKVPLDGVVEKSEIARRLRQTLVWSSMPEKVLEAECSARGVRRAQTVEGLVQAAFGQPLRAEPAKRPATPSSPPKAPAKWAPSSRAAASQPPHRRPKSPPQQPRPKSPPAAAKFGRIPAAAPKAATPAPAAAKPAAPEAAKPWAKPKVRPKSVRPKVKPRPPEPDSDNDGYFGSVDTSQYGPRVRRAVKKFPSYSGDMPPDAQEAEELWTEQDLHNFFFSSGFIRPKKKNLKPKITQAMIDAHYKTLGLKSGSKLGDVRRAYRDLALKYHPDKNQDSRDATERFQGITEAYAVVCSHLEAKEAKPA